MNCALPILGAHEHVHSPGRRLRNSVTYRHRGNLAIEVAAGRRYRGTATMCSICRPSLQVSPKRAGVRANTISGRMSGRHPVLSGSASAVASSCTHCTRGPELGKPSTLRVSECASRYMRLNSKLPIAPYLRRLCCHARRLPIHLTHRPYVFVRYQFAPFERKSYSRFGAWRYRCRVWRHRNEPTVHTSGMPEGGRGR